MLQNVVQQAKSALENPNLTGVPQMRQDTSAENQTPQTGFDMGQVGANHLFLAALVGGPSVLFGGEIQSDAVC